MNKFDIVNLMDNVLNFYNDGNYNNEASRIHYMDLVSVRNSFEFQEVVKEHPEYEDLAFDIKMY